MNKGISLVKGESTTTEHLDNDGLWVTGVGTDHESGVVVRSALYHEVVKLLAKQFVTRVEHVITVAHHRHRSIGKPGQHVAECVQFTGTCPRRYCTANSHTVCETSASSVVALLVGDIRMGKWTIKPSSKIPNVSPKFSAVTLLAT